MKKILILHGTSGNSKSNWFLWLKRNLEEQGYLVWVPDLPHAEKPNISRYNKFIFANKDWSFDEETYIVGHSSGAVAILGLLQHLPQDIKINTCVLVGSFKGDLGWETLNELFLEKFNFDLIKSHARKFIFIHSDNDPYCPLEHAKYLAKKLDGKLIIKKGGGHFSANDDPKWKKFPFILELLKKIRKSSQILTKLYHNMSINILCHPREDGDPVN